MTKKISNLPSPDSFFQAQNAPKSVFGPRWGSLRRSPRPPSRLGRGYPLPITLPATKVSGPLNTKSWLRQWIWYSEHRVLSCCRKVESVPKLYVSVSSPCWQIWGTPVVLDKSMGGSVCEVAVLLAVGCLEGPQTLEQFACQGTELHISCGESSQIHVVDANYGRLDSSMCAGPLLGTPSNDNCRYNATCVLTKWLEFYCSVL